MPKKHFEPAPRREAGPSESGTSASIPTTRPGAGSRSTTRSLLRLYRSPRRSRRRSTDGGSSSSATNSDRGPSESARTAGMRVGSSGASEARRPDGSFASLKGRLGQGRAGGLRRLSPKLWPNGRCPARARPVASPERSHASPSLKAGALPHAGALGGGSGRRSRPCPRSFLRARALRGRPARPRCRRARSRAAPVVRHRADADLGEEAVVAEDLVLEEDLLDDLLRAADDERAAGRAQRVELRRASVGGQPRSRPIAFIIVRVGREELVARPAASLGHVSVRVDADRQRRRMARPARRPLAVAARRAARSAPARRR